MKSHHHIAIAGLTLGLLMPLPIAMAQPSLNNGETSNTVTVKRVLGDVTALLSVDVTMREVGREYKNARIQILHEGKPVFEQAIVDHPQTKDLEGQWVMAATGFIENPENQMFLRDLDGDKNPELVVNFFSGGAHCCSSSVIYYNPVGTDRYEPLVQFWGNGGAPDKLEDLNNDGKVEFISRDDRFAYAFASYAGSGYPIQIWNYDRGTMRDVTKRHKKLIYNNATFWWETFQKQKQDQENVEFGKGSLAAYVADKYLLGQGKEGWELAQKAYYGDDKKAFFKQLRQFLREMGYTGK
jgi:hypothetical protein